MLLVYHSKLSSPKLATETTLPDFLHPLAKLLCLYLCSSGWSREFDHHIPSVSGWWDWASISSSSTSGCLSQHGLNPNSKLREAREGAGWAARDRPIATSWLAWVIAFMFVNLEIWVRLRFHDDLWPFKQKQQNMYISNHIYTYSIIYCPLKNHVCICNSIIYKTM